MNNMELRYSVGALLYSPALNRKITTSILSGQFGNNYSIALCLEDTIADSAVGHALNQMEKTFATLHSAFITQNVVLPKIFVRVRNPEQIKEVFHRISPYVDIFTGFIFPKYSVTNADRYNVEFEKVLEESPKEFYMMPILESEDICSATSFLRNWDSILEKKRANLRSISEPARLRQPPPQKHGSGTRKRAGSKHTGGATNSRPSRAFCPLVG